MESNTSVSTEGIDEEEEEQCSEQEIQWTWLQRREIQVQNKLTLILCLLYIFGLKFEYANNQFYEHANPSVRLIEVLLYVYYRFRAF